MDLAIIKSFRQILRLTGLTNIKFRFDDVGQQIVITFTQAGVDLKEYIKYTELEQLLSDPTEASAEATGSPGAASIPQIGTG